ncbi:MAG: hypothetical protein AB7E13_07865 [Arcobacteraceae bacterium]
MVRHLAGGGKMNSQNPVLTFGGSILEYAKAGYSYAQSLQEVSYEMKHNRASITEHYL